MESVTDVADAPHLRWLRELTSLPTAAGREQRVVAWIERWVGEREGLLLHADAIGNLVVEQRGARTDRPPLFITAHLDHPAFVIERIVAPGVVEASFRGGVMDPYFKGARIRVFAESGAMLAGRVAEKNPGQPFPHCLLEIDGDTDSLALGDIARWELPEPFIDDGVFYTHACDDLAAASAALAALDRLVTMGEDLGHVKLLFTRAEEVGFVGAIGACKLQTMPSGSRVIALENSRSFPHDSPIGAGPIVRVGDRLTTFTPRLTASVSKVAAKLAGEDDRPPGTPSASGDPSKRMRPSFQYQRKLMAGGACEATAFCAYGYEATCVCLPLGNYHNMANLTEVQAGDEQAIATAAPGPEHIALSDYDGMIELLIGCGASLDAGEAVLDKLEVLYRDRAFVLEGMERG